MSNEQKLREAFEARMTDNGKWPRAVEQGRNGCYLLAQTENAWAEWQACAEALATTEPAVNQQLTTEPFDDLPDDMGSLADYFGDLAQQKADLDASRGVSMPVSYYASTVVAAALAWQARAAMAQGGVKV